jgi:hypothetical protein
MRLRFTFPRASEAPAKPLVGAQPQLWRVLAASLQGKLASHNSCGSFGRGHSWPEGDVVMIDVRSRE